jgi:hypothetical protein
MPDWLAALKAALLEGCGPRTAAQEGVSTGPAGSAAIMQRDLRHLTPERLERMQAISREYDIPVGVLIGLASRESHLGTVLGAPSGSPAGWGDQGEAFGVLQVDRRHHTPKGQPDPWSREHIRQAAGIFNAYRAQVRENHPDWSNSHVLKGACVAYNAGVQNVRTIAGMDRGTTNDDYGADVIARARYAQDSIAKPSMITADKFEDYFQYYKQEPHQKAAINLLYEAIRKQAPELLKPDSDWLEQWSSPPEQEEPEPEEVPIPGLTPNAPFSQKVSPNITYGEICLYEEARRFRAQASCDIAEELCAFMEKARAAFGNKPVIITSGHRPAHINAAVGGASNSEHLFNRGCGAVDFYLKGVSVYDVQAWCDKHWPYSIGYGADRGFIHLGIRAGRPRVRWNY